MITTMHLFLCCEQNHYLLPDGEEKKKKNYSRGWAHL